MWTPRNGRCFDQILLYSLPEGFVYCSVPIPCQSATKKVASASLGLERSCSLFSVGFYGSQSISTRLSWGLWACGPINHMQHTKHQVWLSFGWWTDSCKNTFVLQHSWKWKMDPLGSQQLIFQGRRKSTEAWYWEEEHIIPSENLQMMFYFLGGRWFNLTSNMFSNGLKLPISVGIQSPNVRWWAFGVLYHHFGKVFSFGSMKPFSVSVSHRIPNNSTTNYFFWVESCW